MLIAGIMLPHEFIHSLFSVLLLSQNISNGNLFKNILYEH